MKGWFILHETDRETISVFFTKKREEIINKLAEMRTDSEYLDGIFYEVEIQREFKIEAIVKEVSDV